MKLNYHNKAFFDYPGKQTLSEDLLSGEKCLQGFLKIFQDKRSDIDVDKFIAHCDAKREVEEEQEQYEKDQKESREYLMKKDFEKILMKRV